MKKLIFLLTVVFISCAKQDPKEQLQHLNGYWQIDRVEFAEDSVRQFKFSTNVDYLQIDDSSFTGFRKKLRPQINGSFIDFGNKEDLKVKIENDSLHLYYTTPYNNWNETVLNAEENKMSLRNQNGIIYHYKRFKPLLEQAHEKKQ